MNTAGKGTFIWVLAIRSLHNALIEDGFDKLEHNFSKVRKTRKWNFWVRFIRKQIAKSQKKYLARGTFN